MSDECDGQARVARAPRDLRDDRRRREGGERRRREREAVLQRHDRLLGPMPVGDEHCDQHDTRRERRDHDGIETSSRTSR
jgi:hypothetical protein